MSRARMAAIHAAAFAGHGQIWFEDEIAALQARPFVHAVTHGADGFALLQIVAPEAEVLTLAVDPAVQGRGIGTALLRLVLRAACDAGATTLFLEVAADNAAARALYARAGFAQTGRRRGYYARPGAAPADALILSRALTAEKAGMPAKG